MSDAKFIREPSFTVDPECEQVALFFEQWPLNKSIPCFSYETDSGRFLSPEVYFGIVLSPPPDPDEDQSDTARDVILEDLGIESRSILRIDYAYCSADDSYHLLQFGIPGQRPSSYRVLPSKMIVLVEDYLRYVMEEATIDKIANRGFASGNEGLAFDGEQRVAEGYIGKEGFPFLFPANDGNDDACDLPEDEEEFAS